MFEMHACMHVHVFYIFYIDHANIRTEHPWLSEHLWSGDCSDQFGQVNISDQYINASINNTITPFLYF